MSDDVKAIGHRYVDGINSGNVDRGLFAEGFVYHNPQGVVFDLDGAMQTMALFNAALPDHHTTVEDEVVGEGGTRIVFRWTTKGHHNGDFFGTPPTGKELTSRGVTIMAISDGHITELWESIDILGLLQQMGVIPTPGG